MSLTSDELLQNFFKTGSTVSLPRIDSESQFQEFMRKIPSATNLAAAMTEGLEGPSGEQPAGVPRVPSLDFIKAFLTASRPAGDAAVSGPGSIFGPPAAPTPSFELNGSVALALGRAKMEAMAEDGQPGSATAGTGSERGSRGGTPTAAVGLGSGSGGGLPPPGLPQQPAFPAANLQIAGLQGAGPHAMLNPNVLAAAFMQSQLGGMAYAAQAAQAAAAAATAAGSAGGGLPRGGGAGTGTTTSSEGGAGGGPGVPAAKQQVRRERRMLSNRESARRSRKRKQEHLMTMEGRLAECERERDEALACCATLAEDLRRRDAEISALRMELSTGRGEGAPGPELATDPAPGPAALPEDGE